MLLIPPNRRLDAVVLYWRLLLPAALWVAGVVLLLVAAWNLGWLHFFVAGTQPSDPQPDAPDVAEIGHYAGARGRVLLLTTPRPA